MAMQSGVLRLYLGAAPGVGKTVAMLEEGARRQRRGAVVVVAAVDTHGRVNTKSRLAGLAIVAPLERNGGLNLDRVVALNPDVVLVDDLGHHNQPSSTFARRWQEVQFLVDAGIDVVTTLNIDQLESLADLVENITGTKPLQTLPDSVAHMADQIELIDISPDALRRRLAHGSIYPADEVDTALANYFRPGTLGALREMALLWLAAHVEESLHRYQVEQHIADRWETRERIVVGISGGDNDERLVRRGARMASRLHGDLIGVHVVRSSGGSATDHHQALENVRDLLTGLGGTYREVVNNDVAAALSSFAVEERATQLVIGSGTPPRWFRRPSLFHQLIGLKAAVDVHVVPTSATVATLPITSIIAPSRSRRRFGFAVGVLAVALFVLTVALAHLRSSIELSAVFLLYLSLIVAAAAWGGKRVGVLASFAGLALTNWFFIPPYHSLVVERAGDFIALIVFVSVAVFVAQLVDRAARKSTEADRARSEATALARTSALLVAAADPMPELVDQLRVTFGLQGVSVLEKSGSNWMTQTSSGVDPPNRPEDGVALLLDPSGTSQLVLTGTTLQSQDLRVLRSFADQLAIALRSRNLRADAEAADLVSRADALRTSLLRAVSHDFRTPLASTKAAVTSLLQRDVMWSETDTNSFLTTINESVDRLDRLVGNLLDMSRLQAGAVQLTLRMTALEDVVAAALHATPGTSGRVVVDVPETLPMLETDAALLERVVANTVSNALAWSPVDEPIRIDAALIGARVHLRVIDRGPGVGRTERVTMFEPFQRYGDHSNDAGVGLGLAVARGFADAIGAVLSIEDTPGGGLTMNIDLPAPTT